MVAILAIRHNRIGNEIKEEIHRDTSEHIFGLNHRNINSCPSSEQHS